MCFIACLEPHLNITLATASATSNIAAVFPASTLINQREGISGALSPFLDTRITILSRKMATVNYRITT